VSEGFANNAAIKGLNADIPNIWQNKRPETAVIPLFRPFMTLFIYINYLLL